jgi:hypothetical protein
MMNNQLIYSWKIQNGEVSLFCNSENRFSARVEKEQVISSIANQSIQGIPKEIRNQPNKLYRYFSGTYVLLSPLEKGGFQIQIVNRLLGGMLGGVFSAISSGLGYLTSSNYGNMVKEAGNQARATIELAGKTMNATIDKAEVSAGKTIKKMGNEVKTSIECAGKESKDVLNKASSEIEKLTKIAGIEARCTAKIFELQIESILDKASSETNYCLEKAGVEARKTILSSGEEARDTFVVMTKEVNNTIENASSEVHDLLLQGGVEVKKILDQANQEAKLLIEKGALEVRESCFDIIKKAVDEAEKLTESTLLKANDLMNNTIGTLEKATNGIILNIGEQGRLLIKDTGKEIRVIADEILVKAFKGQEMVIKVAGEESRLTIQAFGNEIRSTLYQLPSISGSIGEQFGRNLSTGILDGLGFGGGTLSTLQTSLKNAKVTEGFYNIKEMLNFVYDQNQLSPKEKYSLYELLVKLYNDISFIEKKADRDFFLLCIGIAALKDPYLIDVSNIFYFYSETNYGEKLISGLPGEVRQLLEKHGENALRIMYPPKVETIELIEPINYKIKYEKMIEEIFIEKKKNLEGKSIMKNLAIENVVFKEEITEKDKEIIVIKNELLKKEEEKNIEKQKEIDELKIELNKAIREIEFINKTKN